MTKEDVVRLLEKYNTTELKFKGGKCNDCKCDVTVIITENLPERGDMTELSVIGGAVFQPDNSMEQFFLKCDNCFEINPDLKFFKECDVYSRVVGYLQPVKKWNPGKQAEWKARKMYSGVLE